VREQKQQFIEDYLADDYSVSELAERFNISRKTAYKWINRFSEDGKKGLEDRDRRPASCPWSTDEKVRTVILGLSIPH
jgi:transposase-like protein